MKLVLDTKELIEDFFSDTRLLGIMAPIKEYQFCWHLNNALGLDFRVNNDIEIKWIRDRRTYFFTLYEYIEPTRVLSHYVYNNQYDGKYLLKEYKHLDFLWLMKGDEVSDESLDETMKAIREIQSVQLVVELTKENIQQKENLIF